MKGLLLSAGLLLAMTITGAAGARVDTGPLGPELTRVDATGAGRAEAKQTPKQQIAALKRENARLKREIARLKARVAALSPSGITAQLAKTKGALDKYQSVDQAKADGYAQASPCESSPEGGMGFHYVSGAAMGDGKIDPARPEILLYAPVGRSLLLVGVEYFKPDADQNLSSDDDRPTLFGRAFDGPMAGHAPGMPRHYDLHVWFWKRNPSGIFAVWNPDVPC